MSETHTTTSETPAKPQGKSNSPACEKSRKSLMRRLFSRLSRKRSQWEHVNSDSNVPSGNTPSPAVKEHRLGRLERVAANPSGEVIRMDDVKGSLPKKTEPTHMTNRLAVVAMKGGVGKSTLSMALAGHFATNGKRVLLVDHDPQATSSDNCLTSPKNQALTGDRTIMALFHPELDPTPEDITHPTKFDNIWILPANGHFARYLDPAPLEAPVDLQMAVSELIDEVSENFDWVILDSTPALENLAAWNCLTAADYVISPVQMEQYSAKTVVGMEQAVLTALENGNPNLQFLGYVVSEFDNNRKADHKKKEAVLRARYGEQVFDTVIYRRAKIANAQDVDEHIYSYAPKSEEARMFDDLANELVSRIEKNRARRAA